MSSDSAAAVRIAFRTTAGKQIGFGHLRRCMTLAAELAPRLHEPIDFFVAGDSTAATALAPEQVRVSSVAPGEDATVHVLTQSRYDVLIVDDYAISSSALGRFRERVGRIGVIDDLADRVLEVDLVQNGTANAASLNYRTSLDCVRLLGPSYVLLRPAFRDRLPRQAPLEVRTVLVTLGGADPAGQTVDVVKQLCQALPEVSVDVLIGPLFDEDERLNTLISDRVRLHRAPPGVAVLMLRADLAIAAGGQTTYELAACGVPTVALCIADNQRLSLAALEKIPTLVVAGTAALPAAVRELAGDQALRQAMIDGGQSLVDGYGASRVAEQVIQLTQTGSRNGP